MRVSVIVGLEYFLVLCCVPIFIGITVISVVCLTKTMSFGFLFVNVLIFACNIVLQNHIYTVIIDSHLWAEIFEIFTEVLSLLLTAFSYVMVTIEPKSVYLTSFLLPLPHIAWVVKLGIIAANRGIDVKLLQSNEIVNGNDLTIVLHIAACTLLLRTLSYIYFLPFKVYNDPKNPRGPLYFIHGKFWRDLCCRSQVPIEDEVEEDDEFDID